MNKSILISAFFILNLSTIFLLKASPQNIFIGETTLESSEFKITYENYKRNTQFFYGHIKEIHFRNYSLNYSDSRGYDFGVFVGDVNVAGRKSENLGYGVRLGISRDIWGDLVILPLWKYYAGISGGLFNISKYHSVPIDIDYKFLSFNLAILCAKTLSIGSRTSTGIFIPYGGVRFFYNIDEFKENRTDVKHSGNRSGFSPFIGVKVPVMSGFSIQWTSQFIDEKGYSLSIGYLW